MIRINGSDEYLTLSLNEAVREIEGEWKRAVILRFPAADFSEEQAKNIAENALTAEIEEKDRKTTYYLGGIIDEKANGYFYEEWVLNPETMTEDGLSERVGELENIVGVLLGGEDE